MTSASRICLAVALVASATASAGPSAKRTTVKAASQATTPAKTRKVLRLDSISVEGRVQKAQAFYILQRSRLTFDELTPEESFSEKIVGTVARPPF